MKDPLSFQIERAKKAEAERDALRVEISALHVLLRENLISHATKLEAHAAHIRQTVEKLL